MKNKTKTTPITCPSCSSDRVGTRGQAWSGEGRRVQNYSCKKCGKRFSKAVEA